jgi:hypothetical protein
MKYKQVAELAPWTNEGNPECPFCCIGCEHLKGIKFNSCDDVEIECDLED